MECLYAEDVEERSGEHEKEAGNAFIPEDYDEVRNLVFAKLINTKRNLDILAEIPNTSVLDLSLVYYVFQNHDPEAGEILVTNETLKKWDVEEFDLFQDAVSNTRNLLGYILRPLRDMLSEMIRDMDVGLSLEDDGHFPMYVLTNIWKRNGAVCLIFDDILEEFAAKMESDLFVIPSSIHELILVPANETVKRQELDRIIGEVNRNELARDEILSEHSYYYSRKVGKVIL